MSHLENDDTARWGTPRSKTVRWWDPAGLTAAGQARGGLDFLRAIRDGELPPIPIGSLFSMRIVEVEPGSVVFECEPDESAYNPIGVVHGGVVCLLADSVAGCSVHTLLDPGVGYTSIDLNVTYHRPVTSASGVLRGAGTCVKSGRRVSYATAEIVDGAGKLVASATSSCLIIDRR